MNRLAAALCLMMTVSAFILPGCGRDDGGKPFSGRERPNIVLVLVDSLRKDHVGCYGYDRKTTPFIDSLANEGLLMENDVAQAPWTDPSVGSIMTSKYPVQIGVGVYYLHDGQAKRGDRVREMSGEAVTLAELLSGAGYSTGCVSANPFVKTRAESGGKGREFGLLQGFEHHEFMHFARAGTIISKGMRYIESLRPDRGGTSGGKPFFLYLHLMDVHEPTNPLPPYDTMYPTLDSAKNDKKYFRWGGFNKFDARLDTDGFRNFKSHKHALYDGGLTYIDAQLVKLVNYLKRNKMYENTVIVVASDHGEEFWEHAEFEKKNMRDIGDDDYGAGHGRTLFRELVDVPLIFHGPGVPSGSVKQQVRNIDIMPTMLGLAGVEVEPGSLEGIDIIGGLKSGTLKDMPAYNEQVGVGYEKKGLQKDGYKYIMYVSTENKGFLFDKAADPFETEDVSARHPDVVDRYRAEITAFFEEKEKGALTTGPSGNGEIDEETKKQLKSLGYLH